MKSIKPRELKSYKCSLDGEHWTTINALSSGMAKSEFWSSSLERDVPYIYIKCRVEGLPYTSEEYKRMATYRKIEFSYCGMPVKVGDWNGVIVGYNSSSNLDVLAIDGPYKNQVCNCHPHSEVTYFNNKGEVIKSFKK